MVRFLLLPLVLLLAGPAAAEMVHRDNFRFMTVESAQARRADCGPFAGDPDRLVYQMITAGCGEPGTLWPMEEVGEVQVTRAWAKLGYLAYQVLLVDVAGEALKDEEWRFELTPIDEETWQLDFAGRRWRCHPGYGAESFTTTPCG